MQRAFHKLVYDKNKEKAKKKKESKRSERQPKARQTLGIFGKWLFLLLNLGQHWLWSQCGSRRTTKKDGRGDEDAARSADQREQMDRGNPTKVEAAKRRRQD